jgi:BMFP domain-containing protein YqiC
VAEREGLIARIRQVRRLSPRTDARATSSDDRGTSSASTRGQDELRALEARISHLEQLVQGLQDSVHRESTRLTERVGELEARIQPAAVARALSEDARERGL